MRRRTHPRLGLEPGHPSATDYLHDSGLAGMADRRPSRGEACLAQVSAARTDLHERTIGLAWSRICPVLSALAPRPLSEQNDQPVNEGEARLAPTSPSLDGTPAPASPSQSST